MKAVYFTLVWDLRYVSERRVRVLLWLLSVFRLVYGSASFVNKIHVMNAAFATMSPSIATAYFNARKPFVWQGCRPTLSTSTLRIIPPLRSPRR